MSPHYSDQKSQTLQVSWVLLTFLDFKNAKNMFNFDFKSCNWYQTPPSPLLTQYPKYLFKEEMWAPIDREEMRIYVKLYHSNRFPSVLGQL